MEVNKKMIYEYWFASLQGISSKRKIEIRNIFQDLEGLYNIEETQSQSNILKEKEHEIIRASRNMEQIKREFDKMINKNIYFCTRYDKEYPAKLENIYAPPYAIFYSGMIPMDDEICISVVGARECTYYGKYISQEIGKMCAHNGISIVSGMARGVDGISQGAALAYGGRSYGILGSGVDICYPKENIQLYEQLKHRGGLISEFPPGTQPLAKNFPARNRIISALSDVLIVVEAKEKSGSLITADFALDQGKTVYAVPGPLTSLLSRGCNKLIKQGAELFLSVEEMMEDLKINHQFMQRMEEKNKIMLETKEFLVYSCLDLVPLTLDEIKMKTNLEVGELVAIMTSLEMKNCVEVLSRHYYIKKEQNTVLCS